MEKATCKYMINAIGRGGEMYLTYCQNRQEVNKWVSEHQEKLLIKELKIIKKKESLSNWFSF